MTQTPTKTDDDLSLADFRRLVRVGKDTSPEVADAFARLEGTWRAGGVARFEGRVFRGGPRRYHNFTSFCIPAAEAPALASALGLRVGGFPPKGNMLIRDEAARRLRVTKQNPRFAEAWQALELAARRGDGRFTMGATVLRVGVVSSGTRSAAALHPGDVDAFATEVGLTLHLREAWEPGWLNESEAAKAVGTHYNNRGFARAWSVMSRAKAGPPEAEGAWAGVRAKVLKKAGVATIFLHEEAVHDFVRTSGTPSMAAPPPRTEDWLLPAQVAKAFGLEPYGPEIVALVERLAAQVDEGGVPMLDGDPVRFMRRSGGVNRPWCFHRDEMARLDKALPHRAVQPGLKNQAMRAIAAEGRVRRSEIPVRGEGEAGRSEAYLACGASVGGTVAAKSVWDDCIRQWAVGPVASVQGRRIEGGLRLNRGAAQWCIAAGSLPAFVAATDEAARTMTVEGVSRIEACVALRTSPKDPAFRELWAEVESLAAGRGEGPLRGIPFKALRGRREGSSQAATYIPEQSLETLATLLGRRIPSLLDDETGYLRSHMLAEALGVPNDGYLRILVSAMRDTLDAGLPVSFEGEEVICGYARSSGTPFAVSEASLPVLGRWLVAVKSEGMLLVSDRSGYAEEADMDALLGP